MTGISDLVVITDANRPEAVLASLVLADPIQRPTVWVWHRVRNEPDARPPGGVLYRAEGPAVRLDDLLARVWALPEVEAMRATDHRCTEANLTTWEQAQAALDAGWAEFLATLS